MIRTFSFLAIATGLGLASISMGAQGIQVPDSLLSAVRSSTVLGNADPAQVLHISVSLKPRYGAELQAFCNSVSDPASPDFRHYLTPQQVGQTFGASATQVNSVIAYLKSKGLKITLSAPNRMAILADGTVAQIQTAFSTQIKNYKGVDPLGRPINFYSNSTALTLPTNVGTPVINVSGIENYTRPEPRSTQTLTPPLTRALYATAPAYGAGFKGQGRTVGISNWDGFRLSNAPLYIQQYNLPVPAGGPGSNISVVTIGGGSQNGPPAGEGDLDFQMELGMAPLASIIIYDGGDLVGVLTKEASDNQCEAISESWGWNIPNGMATSAHNQHLAMTAQGMTYMAASGDSGTQLEPFSYPNYDGEVMMVGGTIATVNDQTGGRISEVAWPGGGGGWSTRAISFNKRPSWQVGNGVPTNINFRLSPDIALHAAGSGGAYYFFYNGGLAAADGTSFASPINCGCFAILEQRLAFASQPSRLGRVQNLIYAMNGRADAWNDITSGSNGILPNGQVSNAGPGWDFTTGWGAPNFEGLYNALLQQISPVQVTPVDIEPFFGDYVFGDEVSVASVDGIMYQLGSKPLRQLGQAAGADLDFVLPLDTSKLQIAVVAYAERLGGTTMAWLWNWNTGRYDLIGATPIPVSGDTVKLINVRNSAIANYLDANGNVQLRIRGHFPIKFGQNPLPFTYQLDMVNLYILENP